MTPKPEPWCSPRESSPSRRNSCGRGDYSYGSSTLSVPGIAFDFALPGQTTQGAYPWTDYDRFAVGPRNYVMLFNKQAEAGE